MKLLWPLGVIFDKFQVDLDNLILVWPHADIWPSTPVVHSDHIPLIKWYLISGLLSAEITLCLQSFAKQWIVIQIKSLFVGTIWAISFILWLLCLLVLIGLRYICLWLKQHLWRDYKADVSLFFWMFSLCYDEYTSTSSAFVCHDKLWIYDMMFFFLSFFVSLGLIKYYWESQHLWHDKCDISLKLFQRFSFCLSLCLCLSLSPHTHSHTSELEIYQ